MSQNDNGYSGDRSSNSTPTGARIITNNNSNNNNSLNSRDTNILCELTDESFSPRSNSLDSGRYTQSSSIKTISISGKTSISSEYSERKDSLDSNYSSREEKLKRLSNENGNAFKDHQDSGISSPTSVFNDFDSSQVKRENKILPPDFDVASTNIGIDKQTRVRANSVQVGTVKPTFDDEDQQNSKIHYISNSSINSVKTPSNNQSKFHFRFPKLMNNNQNSQIHSKTGGLENFVHRIRSISIGVTTNFGNNNERLSSTNNSNDSDSSNGAKFEDSLLENNVTATTTTTTTATTTTNTTITTNLTDPKVETSISTNSRARSKSINSTELTSYPDPLKLPKEYLNTSINFTKNLRNSKKWMRMTHSLSCDVDNFNVHDFASAKMFKGKRTSTETLFNTDLPAMSRIEKYLSGYLDTSTPNGALISVMKQGLRKVSESDRYMLLSRSPLRSPCEFLESGIERMGDTEMLLMALHHSTCYDLMPFNGKMLILDSILPINKAFQALDEHAVNCAPIWNSTDQSFCGVLSRDDQIFYLALAYELSKESDSLHCNEMSRLSDESLTACIEREPERHLLKCVNPEEVVSEALNQLNCTNNMSLLVHDTKRSGNALFFLDYRRIIIFLLDSCRAGLPIPPLMKTPISLTDLMMPRHMLATYRVRPESSLDTLLQVMQDNHHKIAIVTTAKPPSARCLCVHETVAVITVDDIAHFISKSQHHETNTNVSTLLNNSSQVLKKISWCLETDSIFKILQCFATERINLILVKSGDDGINGGNCVHSVISMKDVVQYIMKYDPCKDNGQNTNSNIINKKRKCFRSISCCEDPRHRTDMNLSAMSLDEKEEDVFNMEIS